MAIRTLLRSSLLPLFLPLLLTAAAAESIPANTWVRLSQDAQGARRASAIRYAEKIDAFLLWGFLGHPTEDYGNPEEPWDGNREYDVVTFDLQSRQWRSHLPVDMQSEWSKRPPPVHECNSYYGITTGSYRPELKLREGVLRPDLNIVFDQVAYDSKRGRMIYFTGGRTFAYDAGARTWSDAAPDSPAPPPVSAATLAYDPVNDEIVLAAGGHVVEKDAQGRMTGYTGTWIFDCTRARWRPLASSTQPPPRMNTRLVYDSRNRVMVLFAGDGQSRYLADTWLYSVATRTWRKSRAPGGPAARAGHFTVYDDQTGWVLAGGGYNRNNLSDLWAYDAAADVWKKLKGEVPTGWHISADIAPRHNVILLTTANKAPGDSSTCNELYPVRTTYAFRISREGLIDDSVRPQLQAEIWKRTRDEAVAGTAPDPTRARKQAETLRRIPPNQWVLLDAPGRPGVLRTWGSCSFDEANSRIVYWGGGHCGYGGSDYDLYDLAQNTWIASPLTAEYPERAWDMGVNPAGVTFGGAPFIRHGRKVYAWDPVSKLIINTKTILLTSGYAPALLKNIAGEDTKRSSYRKWVTMTYNPADEKWDLLCSGVPGLDLTVSTPHGVMAVDHYWDVVETKVAQHAPNSVYLLDVAARQWKKLPNPGPSPDNLYELTELVYDSKRDQLLLHGGGVNRDELWSYSLAAKRWAKLEPQGATPPVCGREAVYLPKADVLLTAGSPAAGPESPALYAYHVGQNRWEKLTFPPPAGRRAADLVSQNRAWTYDPVRALVLMVLGTRRGDVGSAQVYALRYEH
jgi:hypothetical protein